MSLQFGGLIKYFIRKCSEKNVQKVCDRNLTSKLAAEGGDLSVSAIS